MNKQIKEFRFRAAEYANDQKPLGTTQWNEIRDEKFAELIVKECARQVSNTDLEDVDGGDSAVLRAAADGVRARFGIE